MRATILDFEKPINELEEKIEELKEFAERSGFDISKGLESLEKDAFNIKKKVFQNLTRWNIVGLASCHPERPQSLDYIKSLFQNRVELHGDKLFADDPALTGGLGWFNGQPIVYLGQQKGKSIEERVAANWGYMHPEGYRKALRLMKLAEKFDRPIISFIDTTAAWPGAEAEQRGQAMAIARNLAAMTLLSVPMITVIIGEGGSGGALGIAMGDRVLMLEYAIYCVCPPEACSSIIWKSDEYAPEAAEALKLTATDLIEFGIVDEIIQEPLGGAHRDPASAISFAREAIERHLSEVMEIPRDELLEKRYQRYRDIGVFVED